MTYCIHINKRYLLNFYLFSFSTFFSGLVSEREENSQIRELGFHSCSARRRRRRLRQFGGRSLARLGRATLRKTEFYGAVVLPSGEMIFFN